MGVAVVPEGYKDSSVGVIPVDWSCEKLGSTIEKIVGGGTPSKEVEEFWQGDIPWASVKDFTGTRLTKTVDYISLAGLESSASNLIPAGTLIIPTRMALGKAAFFDKNVAINQDLKALYPTEKLEKEFLFYWFQANAETIESEGTGSTVKGIRLEVLKEFFLAFPPLPEQKKIARILSTVDRKLELIDQQITATQTLKKGLMQKLFSEGVGSQDDSLEGKGQWQPHTEFKDSELGRIPVGWEVRRLGVCRTYNILRKEGSITPQLPA
ncbi:hypothetical protein ACH42_05230 [Endozoicomonas sp. (ex Bugula neritina AB1)]|nr:hypothetical protein ACH42_05230 [Endozoicomonas sp. (ex Bugula neritina AB1)]